MTADLIRELQRIQRYATGLGDLLAHAQAQAPRRAEGTDRSGGVRVVLGPDGFPETIRVESGWERRLAPEAFGGAVGEAFSAAMGERLAEWTDTLRREGWQSEVDRLKSGSPGGSGGGSSSPSWSGSPGGSGGAGGNGLGPSGDGIPPALRRRPEPKRPIGDVAEDMIRAFDTVDAMARPPAAASGTGSAAGGRLTVTLAGNGALSCTAEPQWVSRQSPAALMSALNEALHEARADLERQPAAAPPPATTRLDGLLDEALAALANPLRPTH
jgi:hypothetical protein